MESLYNNNKNRMGGIDMPKINVKCRHGVEYSLLAIGTKG